MAEEAPRPGRTVSRPRGAEGLSGARSRGASARIPAPSLFFAGPVWVVSGSCRGFPAAKATDSRLGAPPYRELCKASAVRRILLMGLSASPDSRSGASGGAVAVGGIGSWPSQGAAVYPHPFEVLPVESVCGIACGGEGRTGPPMRELGLRMVRRKQGFVVNLEASESTVAPMRRQYPEVKPEKV